MTGGEIILGLVVLGLILVAIFAPEDRATREHNERMAVLGGMIAGADQWLADHRRRHTDLDAAVVASSHPTTEKGVTR